MCFLRLNRSSAAAATISPSITKAAAESCPCEIRYSRSSRPGQCDFLNGTEFSNPLIPKTIMIICLPVNKSSIGSHAVRRYPPTPLVDKRPMPASLLRLALRYSVHTCVPAKIEDARCGLTVASGDNDAGHRGRATLDIAGRAEYPIAYRALAAFMLYGGAGDGWVLGDEVVVEIGNARNGDERVAWAPGSDDAARGNKDVEGSWEGSLKVTPQIELRITLDVTLAKDGSLAGRWGSPDEGLKDLPLASIAFKDGILTFKASNAGATYSGKLNGAEAEIVGEWTQRGRTFPLTFKRYDPSKVVVMPIPKELEGIWEGKLKVNGGIELRLVLKVEKGKDGALESDARQPRPGCEQHPHQLDRPQGQRAEASKARSSGRSITGKKDKEGTAFEGEFNQAGLNLPLTLKKTDKITRAGPPANAEAPVPVPLGRRHVRESSRRREAGGHADPSPGRGPFPAVILITGSGAQDRDESLLGHKPFLVLADDLTRRGVAVLRVDDRGVGGSTGSIDTVDQRGLRGRRARGRRLPQGTEGDRLQEDRPDRPQRRRHHRADRGRAVERRRVHRAHGRHRLARCSDPRGAGPAHPQGRAAPRNPR